MRRYFLLMIGFAFLAGAASVQSMAQGVKSTKEKSTKDDKESAIRKASDDDLLKMLKSRNDVECKEAQQEIIRRVNHIRGKLFKLASDELQWQSTRHAAFDVLKLTWKSDAAKAVQKWLDDSVPKIRQLAAQTLAANVPPGDRGAHEALVQHLFDADKTVRRAVYLAIGKIGAPGAADALGNALVYDNGKDAKVRSDLIRAIEMLGKKGIAKLLALADSGEMSELARARDAFLALRTRPGLDALPIILKNYHLGTDDKVGLILSFSHYSLDPPPSPDSFAKSVQFVLGKEKNARDLEILQKAVLKALKSATIPKKGPTVDLLEDLLRTGDTEIRLGAIDLLGRNADGAKIVANYFLKGTLPVFFRPRVAGVLRSFAKDSKEHAALLEKVMKK